MYYNSYQDIYLSQDADEIIISYFYSALLEFTLI